MKTPTPDAGKLPVTSGCSSHAHLLVPQPVCLKFPASTVPSGPPCPTISFLDSFQGPTGISAHCNRDTIPYTLSPSHSVMQCSNNIWEFLSPCSSIITNTECQCSRATPPHCIIQQPECCWACTVMYYCQCFNLVLTHNSRDQTRAMSLYQSAIQFIWRARLG